MYRILICEDDPKLLGLIREHLERYGYQALAVADYGRVLEEFQQTAPHLVLMDVNLPQYDGFYWCRQIRSVSHCPIVFISARSGGMDQVMALEYGADDYVTKPLQLEVLVAKLRSHLRRAYGEYAGPAERVLQQGELILYPDRLEAEHRGRTITLTKKENDLLEALTERYPRLASREELLDRLWDDETYVDENTLSVNVTRLRRKLQELGLTDAIETVRGAGYKLRALDHAPPHSSLEGGPRP